MLQRLDADAFDDLAGGAQPSAPLPGRASAAPSRWMVTTMVWCRGCWRRLTWRESGLGAPTDTGALNDKLTQLEQRAADLRVQLSERDDELAAARAVNRDLMTRINHEPEN